MYIYIKPWLNNDHNMWLSRAQVFFMATAVYCPGKAELRDKKVKEWVPRWWFRDLDILLPFTWKLLAAVWMQEDPILLDLGMSLNMELLLCPYFYITKAAAFIIDIQESLQKMDMFCSCSHNTCPWTPYRMMLETRSTVLQYQIEKQSFCQGEQRYLLSSVYS